jgi:MOSC domain-containing protein YiiM
MLVAIRHIFISPGHNFVGHHGQPAGEHRAIGVPEVMCRAGRGLEGDRFHGYRPDYKGQISFFAWETYEAVKREFAVPALAPGAFRRNVLVEGADLNALIGRRFSLGGVIFEGTEESKPCHWMNAAVAPGAEAWLRGQGGLRAKIITDGRLVVGAAELAVLADGPELSWTRAIMQDGAVKIRETI